MVGQVRGGQEVWAGGGGRRWRAGGGGQEVEGMAWDGRQGEGPQ